VRRALLALALLTAAACAKHRPNVLLVTFDTTRADRVGFAGAFASGHPGVTPSLDALAKTGTAFTTAIASQPLTAPSHASILTGLQPFHHGLRNNGAFVLDASHATLARRLHDAGYATHAIVASYVLDHRFGFDQGFDAYDDDLGGGRELGARAIADKALRWLALQKPERPFFLWLHFYDPHAPYTPPADVAWAFPNDAYAAEIHYADRELGRVLDALRAAHALDDTLVVFTSDHGEAFGEHGERGHGLFVYDETTRVPLLFAGPHVPRGRTIDTVARHVDLVPTILDLLGINAQNLDGTSLFADKSARRAYSETFAGRMNFGWSELRSLRSDAARVIRAPRAEAYDVRGDRAERHNLYGASLSRESRSLFAQLDAIAASDAFRGNASAPVDEETRRKLAALGYIVSTAPRDATNAADPKDRIAAWQSYGHAQELLRTRQFDAAAAELRALQASESQSNAVASLLAQALALGGHRDDALAVLQHAVAREPSNTAFVIPRAELLRDAGRLVEAEALLRETQRLDPSSSAIAAALGDVLNRSGKSAEALQLLEEAHRRDPKNHAVAYNLGVLYERAQRLPDALAMYTLAVRADPSHSMSWNNLGSVLDRTGHRREALAAIAKAHRLDSDNVDATYNLGALLFESNQPKAAIPLLADAARRRPDLLVARMRLAYALERSGDTTRAVAMWRDVAARQPRAWAKVASLELQLGHRERAQDALRRGIALVGTPLVEVAERDAGLRTLLYPPDSR